MNDSERKEEWVRYLKICALRSNGLLSILKNDGEKMLQDVLKALKLNTAMDLIKWLKETD